MSETQHFLNSDFRINLKLPIENYFLDYFVIPSQTLRISSGLRLRTASDPLLFCHSFALLRTASDPLLFCHSDPERSEGEESDSFPRKRSEESPSGDPSATPQGDK